VGLCPSVELATMDGQPFYNDEQWNVLGGPTGVTPPSSGYIGACINNIKDDYIMGRKTSSLTNVGVDIQLEVDYETAVDVIEANMAAEQLHLWHIPVNPVRFLLVYDTLYGDSSNPVSFDSIFYGDTLAELMSNYAKHADRFKLLFWRDYKLCDFMKRSYQIGVIEELTWYFKQSDFGSMKEVDKFHVELNEISTTFTAQGIQGLLYGFFFCENYNGPLFSGQDNFPKCNFSASLYYYDSE